MQFLDHSSTVLLFFHRFAIVLMCFNVFHLFFNFFTKYDVFSQKSIKSHQTEAISANRCTFSVFSVFLTFLDRSSTVPRPFLDHPYVPRPSLDRSSTVPRPFLDHSYRFCTFSIEFGEFIANLTIFNHF